MSKEIDELLAELKGLAAADLVEYSKALIVLKNSQDAGMLYFDLGEYSYTLPLIHIEVIAMFEEFLQGAIEYYKEDCR